MDYIFLNDAMLQKENAFLHVSDLSIHRGFGIFDFFKLKERENPWLEHYLNRFYNSLKFAHIPFKYSRSELKSMMIDLFEKNKLETGYVKLVCTGGYSPDGYSPPDESNFMMFTFPLSIFPNKPEGEGYNLITTEFIRPNPIVKSTNYFNSVMHFARMKEYDAVDVLYHFNGKLSECSRCNIYIIKDSVINTPDRGILEGITRLRILELREKGFEIVVRPIDVLEIFTADEIFVSSTAKGVMPVVNIEGKNVNGGKVREMCKALSNEMEVF